MIIVRIEQVLVILPREMYLIALTMPQCQKAYSARDIESGGRYPTDTKEGATQRAYAWPKYVTGFILLTML